MRRFAWVLVLLLGCGSDAVTDPGASVEALCRDWCTCTNDANEDCLNSCKNSLTTEGSCERDEDRRYRTCMVERSCSDPFNDCDGPYRYDSEAYMNCHEAREERCRAQCEGMSQQMCPCSDVCYYGSTCEQAQACHEWERNGGRCDPGQKCWIYGTGGRNRATRSERALRGGSNRCLRRSVRLRAAVHG